MRVSDLAKSLSLPAGIVLAQAKAMELEVSTTLSRLDDDEINTLKGYYSKLNNDAREKIVAEYQAAHQARRAKAETARVADVASNRAVVEARRREAIEADAIKHGKTVPAVEAEAPKAEAPKAAAPAPAPEAPKAKSKPAAKAPAPKKETIDLDLGPKMDAPAAPVVAAPVAEAPAPVAAPAVEDDDDDPAAGIQVHGSRNKPHTPTKPHMGARNDAQRNNNGRNNPPMNRFGKKPQGGMNGRGPAPAPAAASSNVSFATVNGKNILLRAPVTVKELAELIGSRPNMLIADLMKLNVLASINQRLEIDVAKKVASKYGFTIEVEERTNKRSGDRKPVLKSEDADDDIPEDKPEEMTLRPPVVTFLGHVDHGKTTLMDYIRQTRVAAGEAGGITQHIGAYTIDHKDRQITFIDTPGHAAFSAMRERGANITDIAVIIVAADDGVKPQTKEAIQHARDANAQMLVAITKCDKPEANTDRVRRMLQAEGLTPEEWGGDVVCCEVSGITGEGVDNLLEMILLQADVLELKANPKRRANGAVIESQLEQGLGPTATLLVQGGTLHVGDILLCGEFYGKVRALIDERGKRVKDAGPSIAVKCTGLSGVPEAGSTFRVMLNEKRARELAEKTAEANKLQSLSAAQSASMADWTSRLGENGTAELGVILKADTQGTAEAVEASLKEIVSKKVSLKILYVGVGSIAAADVARAGGDGGAIIVGFNVSSEPNVQTIARQNGVLINSFRIIYELIEHVKRSMLNLIPPEYKEVVRGHAEIRQVFDISKLGRIAGSQMMDGTLRFKGKYRIFRGKEIIYDGAIHTMKHFKDDVKEVTAAQECGLGFGSFEGFREGDIIECYEMEELPKSL